VDSPRIKEKKLQDERVDAMIDASISNDRKNTIRSRHQRALTMHVDKIRNATKNMETPKLISNSPTQMTKSPHTVMRNIAIRGSEESILPKVFKKGNDSNQQ
jgi:hypothetical protein